MTSFSVVVGVAQVEIEEFNDIVSGDQRSVGMGEAALLGNEEGCKKAHGKIFPLDENPASHPIPLLLHHDNLYSTK